jgi:hypothetical protein
VKKKLPELFRCRPLTQVETVSGIDGLKFIDSMNLSTSPGFPFSGDKNAFVVELDPNDEHQCPRTFSSEIWEEFYKARAVLKTGERKYFIWKACLKDEPTKLTKEKVRVFQSAPLVLQLLIRMYFLPLVRIIQMNPLDFECAVGINAEGLEWEELWKHVMSKGAERVMAGDYVKYDLCMPAQLVLAAFDILIEIAEMCEGYTEEDLAVMRNTVAEIVYPLQAYDGDLIQLFGTNPSGQNLTVIINSIVNSLLLRCCFYTIYPTSEFQKEVAASTYGDDIFSSVSETHQEFNHIAFADFLREYDIEFTMPDKEAEPKKFMHENEVDFLKRKNKWNEDLGHHVGVLSEASIFKRLHAHLLSKELTLPEQSAQNIDSSLHDWFYYGRETYEKRQKEMKQIAEEHGISKLCQSLDTTYDMKVLKWREKYLGEPLPPEEPVVLNVNCGDLYVGTYDYLDHCIGTGADITFWWEKPLWWINQFWIGYFGQAILTDAYWILRCGFNWKPFRSDFTCAMPTMTQFKKLFALQVLGVGLDGFVNYCLMRYIIYCFGWFLGFLNVLWDFYKYIRDPVPVMLETAWGTAWRHKIILDMEDHSILRFC